MTYEELRKANEAIKLVDIKGKMYAPVSERVKAFRIAYPTGWIRTDVLSNEDGVCVIKATVGVGDITLGTGTAYEREGGTYINKTSYIENCETSAVGRALGFAGFGIDTDIASAEELTNAELNNMANDKIDQVAVFALRARCKAAGVREEDLCQLYKVKRLEDLTNKKHENINEHWDKIAMRREA